MQHYLAAFAKASAIASLAGLIVAKINAHMAIHLAGILLATTIAVISCNSYYRNPRPKVLLLATAFILLALNQFMEALESLGMRLVNLSIPFVGIEVIHCVSFAAVVFLAAGVLKKE